MTKAQSKRGRTESFTKGRAQHRRTSSDYMAALLDAVPVETWTEIVTATVGMAKMGDAQARQWLSAYLIGRAAAPAPTPLSVTVQQWTGTDPVSAEIAKNEARLRQFSSLYETASVERAIQEAVSAEIESKLAEIKKERKPAPALASGQPDNVIDVDFDS